MRGFSSLALGHLDSGQGYVDDMICDGKVWRFRKRPAVLLSVMRIVFVLTHIEPLRDIVEIGPLPFLPLPRIFHA